MKMILAALFIFVCGFSTIPDWVIPVDYPTEFVEKNYSNEQTILIDTQFHTEEKTYFFHEAAKLLNTIGAESWDQIRFSYMPSIETLTVHEIRVFREGVWSDRLNSAKQMVTHSADSRWPNVFFGEQTVIYFLEDIRPGDIVDYSYSCTGLNSIRCSRYCPYSAWVSLQLRKPVERISHRVLAPIEKPLHWYSPEGQAPQVTTLANGLQEWIWEARDTPALPREDHQPNWYPAQKTLTISQFATWKEVIAEKLPLYQLPSEEPPPEMAALIRQWMQETNDPKERALLALRFVQDEIHYISFGGYEPTHPHQVFQNRFGDCKSKSFLLQYFLSLMDIPSSAVCVDSIYKGKFLDKTVPSIFFGHVILRITIDQTDYFVDPIRTFQGGDLAHSYIPSFYYGLPIDPAADGLIPIPPKPLERPLEISITGTIDQTQMELDLTTTYYGIEADIMRKKIASQSKDDFKKGHLKALKKIIPKAEPTTPLQLEDNRRENRLEIKGSYRLPNADRLSLNSGSRILCQDLNFSIEPDRVTPYALDYPLWIKETIEVRGLPSLPPEKATTFENDYLYYHFDVSSDQGTLLLHRELKTLSDHVPAEVIPSFLDFVDRIKRF